MAFLPDGRMLVTEKAGRMLLSSADGRRRIAVTNLPEVSARGQGALGDMVPHPGAVYLLEDGGSGRLLRLIPDR